MLSDLYDVLSFIWSSRWPVVMGQVTAVDVQRNREKQTAKLAVAYEFSLGNDGPYSGEIFWQPAFSSERRVTEARRRIRLRQPVRVRYRPDDPSVNTLEGGVSRFLKSDSRS
jgi:Protein of unknown function (DUF3592)